METNPGDRRAADDSLPAWENSPYRDMFPGIDFPSNVSEIILNLGQSDYDSARTDRLIGIAKAHYDEIEALISQRFPYDKAVNLISMNTRTYISHSPSTEAEQQELISVVNGLEIAYNCDRKNQHFRQAA